MKNTLRVLLLLPIILLAGCCANDVCDCGDDLLADALYFKLDPARYVAADIDTIYFQRFTLPDTINSPVPANHNNAARPAATVTLTRAQRRSASFLKNLLANKVDTTSLVVLTNTYPFSPLTTGSNISAFRYKILLLKGNRPQQNHRDTVRFDLRNLTVFGRYNADGCCTCYQNTFKSFYLDNTLHVVTEGSNPVQVIPLSK